MNNSVLKIIENLKKNNKKIGLVHGVFDVLHYGHVLHFQEAKKKVDFLIVSITDDKFVNKSPGRPLFNSQTRKLFLKNIKNVDEVILSKSFTAVKNIKLIKPDIYFKGKDYNQADDYTGFLKKEIDAVKSIGGQIHFTNTKMYSSSKIINQKFGYTNNEFLKYLKKISVNNICDELKKIKNKNLKILVLGNQIIDNYIFSNTNGVSNKSQNISVREILTKEFGGGTILISNFLSKISKNVTMIWPDNKNNNRYKYLCDKNITLKKIKTNCKIIEKNRHLDNYSETKLFQHSKNENNEYEKYCKKNIINFLKSNYKKYARILIFDYGYYSIFDELINFFNKKNKIKLYINCQSNSFNYGFNIPDKFKFGHGISLDGIEYRLLVRDKKKTLDDLIVKNKLLFKNFKFYLVTDGKIGCHLIYNKKKYFLPSILTNMKDSIGCGDIFFSLFSLIDDNKNLNYYEKLAACHVAAGIHGMFLGNDNVLNFEKLIKYIENTIK
jgi:rfaE bifunctional protein nucleotidyltransferase chain/domain